MDVVLGVSVSGRVAQLALLGSPGDGGEVFDQYELELTEDATAELAETIIGTDRALAESGNRLSATRLYFPEPTEAETLRQVLLNGGVADVEAVTEDAAATALNPGTDIATDRFALARGAAKTAAAAALAAPVDPYFPPTQLAPVDPSGPATQMAPVGQTSEATQMAPVDPYAPATQMAPVDPAAEATGIDGAVGPQLAYSVDETDSSYGYGAYDVPSEMPMAPLGDLIPEQDDDATTYTEAVGPVQPRMLLMGSAVAFLAVGIGTLAVTVAISVRPTASASQQPAPVAQSQTVPGRYLPPVPHEPDPVAKPIAVLTPAPAAPVPSISPQTGTGNVNRNTPSAPVVESPAQPVLPPPPADAPALPAPTVPSIGVPVIPLPPIIIFPNNPFTPKPTTPTTGPPTTTTPTTTPTTTTPPTTTTAPPTTTTAPPTTTTAPPTTSTPPTTSAPPTTTVPPTTIDPPTSAAPVTPKPEPQIEPKPIPAPAPTPVPAPVPAPAPVIAPAPAPVITPAPAPAPVIQQAPAAPAPVVEPSVAVTVPEE